MNAANESINLQGSSTGKKKNHINCLLRCSCSQQTIGGTSGLN